MNARLTGRSTAYFLICALGLAGAAKGGVPASVFASQGNKIQPVTERSDHFLWRVDLVPLGYPPDKDHYLQWRRGLDEFDTVDFVSENTVVATFVTEEAVPVERRDDADRPRPYRLHAVFLDASTGKVMKTLDWPTDDPNTGIFPRYDGSFLFFSTERIVLYSADWKPVKELPLRQLSAPHSFLSGIAESPSGKVLLIRFHQNRLIGCIRLFTGTLDGSEDECHIPEMFTVSDSETAMINRMFEKPEGTHFGELVVSLPSPIPGSQLCIGARPCASADTKAPPSHGPPGASIYAPGGPVRQLCVDCQMPQFINNDLLVHYNWVGFGVMDHNGEEKFEVVTPIQIQFENEIDPMGRPIRPSANGQRFAVALNFTPPHPTGVLLTGFLPGDLPSAYPSRVDVYDVEKQARIYMLKNRKNQFKQIWGLGLSPSGEKLVIDSGGVIQVYALPPVTQAASASH